MINGKVSRWRMSVDSNGAGNPPNVYPVLDEEGEWVDYSDYERVERKYKELKEENNRNYHNLLKRQNEAYELKEKLVALAGIIADLKK
jgi:hypothetical protein